MPNDANIMRILLLFDQPHLSDLKYDIRNSLRPRDAYIRR